MRLLVDTQAALWLLSKNERLPPTARELIFDRSVDCFLSAASVWEVAIKRRLGKLDASADFHIHLERHGVRGLPIYDRHATLVADHGSAVSSGSGSGAVTVHPGDSLWAIARRVVGPSAGNAAVERKLVAIWDLNARRIGTGDPNLIFPGTRLRLPSSS